MNFHVTRRTKPMTRAGGTVDVFEMSDGKRFTVNRHGWILDSAGAPLPHPIVDEVMLAILAFEEQVGE